MPDRAERSLSDIVLSRMRMPLLSEGKEGKGKLRLPVG